MLVSEEPEEVDHATALAVEKALKEDRTVRWMEQVDETLKQLTTEVKKTNGRVNNLESRWSFLRGVVAVFVVAVPVVGAAIALLGH